MPGCLVEADSKLVAALVPIFLDRLCCLFFLLALMTYQPQTAGSAERDLIESMLQRQDQVLADLDNLFDRIDAVIEELTEQRKREAAEESENILPFEDQLIDANSVDADSVDESDVDRPSERAA